MRGKCGGHGGRKTSETRDEAVAASRRLRRIATCRIALRRARIACVHFACAARHGAPGGEWRMANSE
ncbi:hypothetical protein BURPS305_3966 [Burkholderia pseudomallei 305]|nr:hypothetical protein BURPS305_3966 [Burkholderia pseudomallei 305]